MPAEHQPVSLEEVRDFLCHRFGDGVTEVAALGAGAWSRAFSFELDGQSLVARFGQHREDFEQDRSAMGYAGPDLPVPRVTEIGSALGGAYSISERYHGVFLESLDAVGWSRVLPALLRGFDALREHPLQWPREWLTDYREQVDGPAGLWGAQLQAGLIDRPGARVSGWRAVLARSPKIDALFEAARGEFTELLAYCPSDPHLIHVDLLNRNVLVAEDASRLVAVFDWGCLKYGDFLYELAALTFWAPWFPGLGEIDVRSAALEHYRATGLTVSGFAERLRCYELHIGLDHLAYHGFTGNTGELHAVAGRTREMLELG